MICQQKIHEEQVFDDIKKRYEKGCVATPLETLGKHLVEVKDKII